MRVGSLAGGVSEATHDPLESVRQVPSGMGGTAEPRVNCTVSTAANPVAEADTGVPGGPEDGSSANAGVIVNGVSASRLLDGSFAVTSTEPAGSAGMITDTLQAPVSSAMHDAPGWLATETSTVSPEGKPLAAAVTADPTAPVDWLSSRVGVDCAPAEAEIPSGIANPVR